MKRLILAVSLLLATAGAAFADGPIALRTRIEARGPALTLGDVFENAGPAGARAIALAPPPGQSAFVPTRIIVAAVDAAGLSWAPPAGLEQVSVTRAATAQSGITHTQSGVDATMQPAQTFADTAVRRGDTIALTFVAPGIRIATRARALGDGAVGDSIRVVNLQSNRQIDAIVTGSGAASANAE